MKLNVKETAIFAMLGAIMFASKVAMQSLPNIHLVGAFIMTFTLVYRKKALYPIYLYITLEGIFYGFTTWWVPYLYIWAVLWGVTMLLPKHMKKAVSIPVYAVVCGLHGLLFGTLFAPAQALFFGLNLKGTIAWIIAGFPYDCIHAAGNLCFGLLIVPLSELLRKLNRAAGI